MNPEQKSNPAFEQLLEYLKINRGFDFTGYKRPSLTRRVRKHMNTVGTDNFEDYQDFLEVHPNAFTELFNTILINVTAFFRDQEAWDYLADDIIPRILKAKTLNATIRVWSAGCASGEEAYSIAILLAEAMGLEACRRQVKIYATDVDEEDLEQARRGAYDTEALKPISPGLRQKYFVRENNNGRYHFRKDLRRIMIFGRHDLMHDAPISRLDLLLCRNTLIYFNREAQDRIAARFHFALKENGFLFLGRAETMLAQSGRFEPVNMRYRFFQKSEQDGRFQRVEMLMQAGEDLSVEDLDAGMQLQKVLFDTAEISWLVVDHHGDLALVNQAARSLFRLDQRELGQPFRDLELSYRPLELRSLIDQAREDKQAVICHEVEFTQSGSDIMVYLDVSITPLWNSQGRWLGTAIAFQDITKRQGLKQELEQKTHELETTYEELQSTNEELETSNEELQSTVEELQTTNEELQSSNEEMETMNEELQSANAELQAINDQLRNRTSELDQVNAFLESILSSVDVGVVAIDQNFIIQLWNERAEDLWGLRAAEVEGSSLLDLDIGLPVDELKEPVEKFLAGEDEEQKVALEAVNRRGKAIHCYVTRSIRRDVDGDPEGVVLLMEEEQL